MTVDAGPDGRRYRVLHRTSYHYGAEMLDGYSVAMLLARQTPQQHVVSSVLSTAPEVDARDDRVDVFGNRVVQMGIHHPHTELHVDVATEVVTHRQVEPSLNPPWERAVRETDALTGSASLGVLGFLARSRLVPLGDAALAAMLLDEFSAEFAPGRHLLDVIAGVCESIYLRYRFDSTSTTVSTPIEQVVEQRSGVCQDFAHLAVGVFRSRGLAARYVSGYIETDPPPGEPKTVGADASHAWCSVWVPNHGWIDFDPTNNLVGPDRHVTIGWGRDYADVAPIRGVVIGPSATQSLAVSVDVARL